jgi:hypothetical protein
MYHFYSVVGSHEIISDQQAQELMRKTAPNWKKHLTKIGTLYTEEHPWAISIDGFGETTEHPPNLRVGGRLHWNTKASRFFDLDIYGDCFLVPNGSDALSAFNVYERRGTPLKDYAA